MMQPITFKIALFNDESDFRRSHRALLLLLEALCRINEDLLRTKACPHLYQSGVRYQPEDGTEEWLDIPHVIEAGVGDCEDLACWRVAELRHAGMKAKPYAKWKRVDGVYHYHALVLREGKDGQPVLEDPSHHLGMPAGTDRAPVPPPNPDLST